MDTVVRMAMIVRDPTMIADLRDRQGHVISARAAAQMTALASAPIPGWVALWSGVQGAGEHEQPRFVVPTELTAYADDMNVAGTSETAVWAYTCLRRSLAPRGMQVNGDKSTLLLPGDSPFVDQQAQQQQPDWTRGAFIERQQGRLPELLRQFAPTVTEDGIDVTGTPVGTREYCARVAMDTARATGLLVDRLGQLPAHHASLILRLSASTKFKHLLRVLPMAAVQDASILHDQAVLRGLGSLADPSLWRADRATGGLSLTSLVNVEVLEDPQVRRATMALHLPVRFGGLGVIGAQRVGHAALVGGYCLVASLLAKRTPSVAPLLHPDARDFNVGAHARWQAAPGAISALEVASAGLNQEAAVTGLAACGEEPVHKLQRQLTRRDSESYLWNSLVHMALDSEARGPEARGVAAGFELAWRVDLGSRGAGAFMHQVPTIRTLQLPDADVRAVYAMRIGVHFEGLREGAPTACGACGTRVAIDPESVSHALACTANTRMLRHDGVKRELAAALRLCGAKVLVEEACVPQRVNPVPQAARRMDLVVRLHQKVIAVDIAVSSVRLSKLLQDRLDCNLARVLEERNERGTPPEETLGASIRGCIAQEGGPAQEGLLTSARYVFSAHGQGRAGRATPEDPLGLRAAFEAAERRKGARYGTSVRARDPATPDRGAREMPLVVFGISTGGGLSTQAKNFLREAAESEPAAEEAAGRGYALTKARLLVSSAVSTAVQRGNARIWRTHATRAHNMREAQRLQGGGGEGWEGHEDRAEEEEEESETPTAREEAPGMEGEGRGAGCDSRGRIHGDAPDRTHRAPRHEEAQVAGESGMAERATEHRGTPRGSGGPWQDRADERAGDSGSIGGSGGTREGACDRDQTCEQARELEEDEGQEGMRGDLPDGGQADRRDEGLGSIGGLHEAGTDGLDEHHGPRDDPSTGVASRVDEQAGEGKHTSEWAPIVAPEARVDDTGAGAGAPLVSVREGGDAAPQLEGRGETQGQAGGARGTSSGGRTQEQGRQGLGRPPGTQRRGSQGGPHRR